MRTGESENKVRYDIVIIGGAIVGSSVAYYL
ncbi:MAG: FAD-binding oxidoreductase, partial [Mesorhizobium sp.]